MTEYLLFNKFWLCEYLLTQNLQIASLWLFFQQFSNLYNLIIQLSPNYQSIFPESIKSAKTLYQTSNVMKKSIGKSWTEKSFLFFPLWGLQAYSYSEMKWNKYTPFKNRDEMKGERMLLFSPNFQLMIISCVKLFMAQYQWEEMGYLKSLGEHPNFPLKIKLLSFLPNWACIHQWNAF